MSVTVVFDLAVLYLVAANVVAILGYVLVLKHRARRLENSTQAVSRAIVDYFRADGIEVSVEAIPRAGGKRFIAFIESEPMKRFRYSHIVEISLRSHVWHVCGQEVDRIFWRFPIRGKGKEEQEAVVRQMETAEEEEEKQEKTEKQEREEKHDEYLREGWEQLKELAGYDISEGSWEEFENTVIRRGGKPKQEQEAEAGK